MTTEEKARAYDEAIERARRIKNGEDNWRYSDLAEIIPALEEVLPELTESEDERIRRKMIEHFKAKTKETWCNMPVKDIIAYLEKQKENPKSADSIPSDCTSDVKCEDRWHKVADSMPDNPREVLCKDEAGNYFIGRYYVGEGWEISNYDDEDKPHHLNPPVSKWIDFLLEEQKPNSTEDMPYITDEHFYEREPADSFKYKLAEYMTRCCTKKEGPYGYEYGISAESILKMAEEELLKRGVVQKPAEWSDEDEKYLNRVINLWVNDFGEDNDTVKWLKSIGPSWKPNDEDEVRLINTSISFLKDFANKGYENAVECIDWLKSKLNGNSGK